MDDVIYEEHDLDTIQPLEDLSPPPAPVEIEPVIIRGTGNLTM